MAIQVALTLNDCCFSTLICHYRDMLLDLFFRVSERALQFQPVIHEIGGPDKRRIGLLVVMSAQKKIIIIIILGTCACLLSFVLSQYFSKKDQDMQIFLAQTQRISAKVAIIQLLGKTFVQNSGPDNWQKIINNLSFLKIDLANVPNAYPQWRKEVQELQTCLTAYQEILDRIHHPAVRLNEETQKFQKPAISSAAEINARRLKLSHNTNDPINGDIPDGDTLFRHIKASASDLEGLHLQKQLLLTKFLMDWDEKDYHLKKHDIDIATKRYQSRLQSLKSIAVKSSNIHYIIDELNNNLARLLEHEQVILDYFATLRSLNAEFVTAGDQLLAASKKLSDRIIENTTNAHQLNNWLNWGLLIAIMAGMSLLGTMLARDILNFVEDLRISREKYKSSEKRLFDLTANVPGLVYQVKLNKEQQFTLVFVSHKALEIFGLEANPETFSDEFQDRIPVDEKPRFSASIEKAVSNIAPWQYEGRFVKPDGKIIWFSANAIPQKIGDDIMFYGVLMDITQRKKMEEALRLTQFCFDRASIGIFRIGEQGEILNVNRQACQSLGYSSEELCRMCIFDIDPTFNRQMWSEHTEQLQKHKCRTIETVHQHKNGDIFPVQILINLMSFEDQEFHIAFVQDISERKRWQTDLEISERRYRALFNEAPVMYVTTENRDSKPYIVDVNDLFLKTLGYDRQDVLGTPLTMYYTLNSRQEMLKQGGYQRALNGLFMAEERSFVTRHGQIVHTLLHALPEKDAQGLVRGTRAMYLDITARKRAEEETKKLEAALRQSRKMEAIGTLAGGIAHDFNNILSAVVGYAQIALTETDKKSRSHYYIQQICTAGMRASELVRQILAFSRQAKQDPKPLQIEPLVKEALKLLRSSLPTTIELCPNIIGNSGNVMADPVQIHQIVMNLCTNAAQAMEETGGKIIVELKQVHVDNSTLQHTPGLSQGDYVKLTVQDSGEGIDPEIIDMIFDPYFTTKESGKGTGLGLSVVHGIIQSYNGGIYVRSKPDFGTIFDVYLPVIDELVLPELEENVTLPKGTETIMLIDDEPILVDVGEQTLQMLGYKVLTCTDSQEALRIFSQAPGDIDLVISDMTMPKMTGDKLAVEMLRRRPDLPIILCTGFSSRLSDQTISEIGVKALAMKPLVAAKLAVMIRDVLDASRQQSTENQKLAQQSKK